MTRGRIGRLSRHRVDIEQDSSADGAESLDYTGTDFASNLPAEIDNIAGSETYRGRQLEAHCDWVVRLRYLAGVTATMRVVPRSGPFATQTWYIRWVQHTSPQMGRLPETWLYCTETPTV